MTDIGAVISAAPLTVDDRLVLGRATAQADHSAGTQAQPSSYVLDRQERYEDVDRQGCLPPAKRQPGPR